MGKLRILLAPLDWGLGHSTRCIPIIRELQNQGAEVFLAGNDTQAALLLQEFPHLEVLPLKGYDVRYSSKKNGLLWSIARQLPKIANAINSENEWLKDVLKNYEFDAVISDNRYGLYHATVPCVFITHQLHIKSPIGNWSEKLLQRWNYSYLNRFSECWIPDFSDTESLAGELSQPEKKPQAPLHYIGPVSRFQKKAVREKKDHLLILLSGPEPQRSILEDKLINEIVRYNGTVDFVRGLPASDRIMPSTNQIHFYNHLPAAELNEKIEEAEFVISRCGYSTVMDLVKLQKKSILIPTQGQTEQEYLADYLPGKRVAYCVNQDQFSLENNLLQAKNFDYQFAEINENLLKNTIGNFLSGLLKG